MLKALLQLLLNTRATKTEAAHFAQPAWGASPIVMTGTDVNDDWGSIYQGVMPNDGVLVVSFTGTNESSYAAGPGAQSLVPWANGGGKFSMAVTKGSYVSLGGNHVKDVELRLYPLAASI